ncbi:AAA-domain-containing protein [Phellopilus nigrolimitatus]|nr:AAA-domain-containing protein [Phellopilus nigrolimitatus]
MPRRARIEFVSLRSSLVNLPYLCRPQSLAVHLLLVSRNAQEVGASDRKQCFVGWTGLASSSSLARFKGGSTSSDALETIEIDPQFASSLGLHTGDVVEIGLLHDLPIATSVTTEPYSADDWEIIELHAAYVEQNLLSQVRVASVGQEVDVWVFSRTRARLRVVSFKPTSAKHEAVLLGTNTEVSIAPKKRVSESAKKSATSVSKPSAEGAGDAAEKSAALKHAKLRVLPSAFFSFSDSSADAGAIAWVNFWTFCDFAAKVPPLSISEVFGPVIVRRLKAPPDPLASDPASAAAPPAAPTAKVIHSADGRQAPPADAEAPKPPQDTLTLRWSREVPDKHIVFENYSGVKEWENCRVISNHNHNLAGVEDYLEKCANSLRYMYILYKVTNKFIGSVMGILITGRPGSGKTSIINAVARMTEDSQHLAHIIYVDFSKHVADRVPRLKAYFNYLYEKAAWHRPSLLVFDNLDKVLSVELEHAESFRSRHLTELFLNVFTRKKTDTKGVAIIATAQSETALHPRVLESHIFKEVVKLKPPSKNARRDVGITLASERKSANLTQQYLSQSEEDSLNFTSLATQTEGYLPTDLKDLVSRAVHEAVIRSGEKKSSSLKLLPVDFEKAQVDFVPLSLRDIKLQKSDVSWADIGGLHETRRVLRETLEWPTKYAAIFANCPLRLRSGLLLYGYPGCGKTLLASAVAKECGLNFISVKGPEILNKYIGASEKSVRDLFERASAAKPCVLFFDEFDSIAPKRGHDSTGVTDRVVNQMLTQMDGAEGLDGVYVLAATSRPDLIDSALLRPGRLDKSLICDMPNFEERKEILKVVSKKVNMSPTIDWDALASATEGYSGADLQAVIYNAHLEVVHSTLADHSSESKGKGKGKEQMSADVEDVGEGEAPIEYVMFGGGQETKHKSRAEEAALQKKHEITDAHLQRSLASTRPSVPADEQARLRRIYKVFVSDRSGEMPMPPEAGDVGSRASLM